MQGNKPSKKKKNKNQSSDIFCQKQTQTQSQIMTPLTPSKPKPLKPNHKPTVAIEN